MKLLEYEAKEVLAKFGVPIPKGGLVTNIVQAQEITKELGLPLTLKAQVPVAGRGKAGGILFAESISEVEEATRRLLDTKIKGIPVNGIWIEEKIQIIRELYFGITIDRLNRRYVAIASSTGGTEIEQVAAEDPERVSRFLIDPQFGFHSFHARQIARHLGYSGKQLIMLTGIFESVYEASMDQDAELVETNPLVETTSGQFLAADARMIIDDNALFRHPIYRERLLKSESGLTRQEREARRSGLTYVELDGNIGVIGNGAGLVMATLDMIKYYDGEPANFLDVGGGAASRKVASALSMLLSDSRVEALLINILGGITRCDEVAQGILEARKKMRAPKPMVIRLVGTNEKEGRMMLREAEIEVVESMEEAAKKVVEITKK